MKVIRSGKAQPTKNKSPTRSKAKKRPKDLSNYSPPDPKTSHLNLLGKRFKIEDDMLGFGSFGRTYLGKDIKRQKSVAIKIVSLLEVNV